MAIQPLPAHGTLNWDIPLNSILAQLGNQWYPSDQGFLAWSTDPIANFGNTAPALGVVTMVAVPLRQTATVSRIILSIPSGVAGVTLTAGQNFAGIYNSAGTRVGVTADQASNWQSTGVKDMPLTVAANLTAGMYYVAVVTNGATGPAFARQTSDSQGSLNANLTAATFRVSTILTGQTSLPASITMASRAANVFGYCAILA